MSTDAAVPVTSPRVFISHSSKDKPFVRTLAADLSANNYRPWVDENEMYAGDSLLYGISQGLPDSSFLLAVYSTNFAASAWAQQEITAAVAMQNSGQKIKVIVLKMDDTLIPALLQGNLYVDFRGDYQKAFETLLQAIQRGSTTISSGNVTLSVDRAKLLAVLDDLDGSDLTRVITAVDGANKRDRPNLTPGERVASLIGYAESSVGPGLNAVAAVVAKLFPNTANKIGPFR